MNLTSPLPTSPALSNLIPQPPPYPTALPEPSMDHVERARPVEADRSLLLKNRYLALEVLPRQGGLASLGLRDGKRWVQLLRAPAPGMCDTLCGELACRPLVKVGAWASKFRPLHPAHHYYEAAGGESPRWQLTRSTRGSVTLALESAGSAAYRLTQTIALTERTVSVKLALRNDTTHAQHLGLGLACSIARDASTWLAAAADGIWCRPGDDEALRWLPTPPAWSMGIAYPLPAATHEHAFGAWAGVARVHRPARGLGLVVAGDAGGYVLSLRDGDDCFGFHPIDCGLPADARMTRRERGTQLLAPGASLQREFSFTVETGRWERGTA